MGHTAVAGAMPCLNKFVYEEKKSSSRKSWEKLQAWTWFNFKIFVCDVYRVGKNLSQISEDGECDCLTYFQKLIYKL